MWVYDEHASHAGPQDLFLQEALQGGLTSREAGLEGRNSSSSFLLASPSATKERHWLLNHGNQNLVVIQAYPLPDSSWGPFQ